MSLKPPMPSTLGLKPGSQTYRIYSILVAAYLNPEPALAHRVPIRIMLEYCPTTNHRARICKLRDLLKLPKIIAEYGRWTIPPAEGRGSNSSYWLERVA